MAAPQRIYFSTRHATISVGAHSGLLHCRHAIDLYPSELAHRWRNALDELGIETEIRNDILGGAAGEIAPGETWIELWIVNDEQAPAAMRRIQEIERQPDEEEWDCHHCEEPNPATFELCWQCQTQRQT